MAPSRPVLTRLHTQNYRSLADVPLDVGGVTVLFGPNGAGKSSLLDVLWFVRDCALNGVEAASERRGHGIGLLWDGADEGDPIVITLATERAEYELRIGMSSGRIDPLPGERLIDGSRTTLLTRGSGTAQATFTPAAGLSQVVLLRDPTRLSVASYLERYAPAPECEEIDQLVRQVRRHHSRSLQWWPLKVRGSESDAKDQLAEDGRNLWSVLRNLQGRSSVDPRYDTIMTLMREAFPSFRGLVIEATGAQSLYGSFVDSERRSPVAASGVSDGHLQLLVLLTALFGGRERSLILLDEPEISLHPWPIVVLARAIERAMNERGQQILIATHSPVLLSQFPPAQVLVASLSAGRTVLRRVSEIAEVQDLIDQYALGSLYMAEELGAHREPE